LRYTLIEKCLSIFRLRRDDKIHLSHAVHESGRGWRRGR
jgi:hypothetical protein